MSKTTKTAQHTPGPWEAADATVWSNPPGDHPIAKCAAHRDPAYSKPSEQEKANARLIAAAPDLLAALESLEHFVFTTPADEQGPMFGFGLQLAEQARAAIARAKGV